MGAATRSAFYRAHNQIKSSPGEIENNQNFQNCWKTFEPKERKFDRKRNIRARDGNFLCQPKQLNTAKPEY